MSEGTPFSARSRIRVFSLSAFLPSFWASKKKVAPGAKPPLFASFVKEKGGKAFSLAIQSSVYPKLWIAFTLSRQFAPQSRLCGGPILTITGGMNPPYGNRPAADLRRLRGGSLPLAGKLAAAASSRFSPLCIQNCGSHSHCRASFPSPSPMSPDRPWRP